MVHDASRDAWVYLMNEKSEASQLLLHFCAMVGTQFRTKLKVVRSDDEYEFASKPMKKFCKKRGIIHQTTCVDTQQK